MNLTGNFQFNYGIASSKSMQAPQRCILHIIESLNQTGNINYFVHPIEIERLYQTFGCLLYNKKKYD